MTITSHPLHRSGRAELPHPAPASGNDAKSPQWIRMMDARPWQPVIKQTAHAFPSQPLPLTAPSQRAEPQTTNSEAKRIQRLQVRRHSIITIVAGDYGSQPLSHLGHCLMQSFAQLLFHFTELGAFPLAYRAPINREHPVAPLPGTTVREAKKVECLRFPLPASFSVVGRKPAKLEQTRFLRMQFQFELGEAFRQFRLKLLSLSLVLKAHDEVVSPADHDHVPFGFSLPPLLHPEVKHVVQIDVGQQRRGTTALWRSLFTARPLPFFQHARVQPLAHEPQYPLVRYPVLEELNQPLMVQAIEERAEVSIQHPAHLSHQQAGVQGIQRIVLAFAWSVAIREAEEVRLIDSIQHRDCRPLDNLIFQRGDAERPWPPVVFGDESSEHCLCSIGPTPQSPGEVSEIALQLLSVLTPRFPIDSRSRIALQPVIGFAQSAQVVDVVHEAGELHLPIFRGCLPYPPQRTLHDFPVQCPVRVLPRRLPFGQTPSLHPLRHWRVGSGRRHASFVHGLRRYYGSVRLPASVHHRRTSLDFSMRPKRAGLGGRRISRFSRRLLPCMPGASDLAGYQRSSPMRNIGCRLPLSPTGSASRTNDFSRLNTQPALSPVNASPGESPHPTHDSGPSWLARPLTFETSIQYNLPVYPGAQEN